MKSVFSICKIYLICFFSVYTFFSCKSYVDVNGEKHSSKRATINVSWDSNDHLTLKDDYGNSADTFDALPGQKITWKLINPGDHRIDRIYEKVSTPNPIFEKLPHHVIPFSKSWRGTLKKTSKLPLKTASDGSKIAIYDYKIDWNNGGAPQTFDPRIQIKIVKDGE